MIQTLHDKFTEAEIIGVDSSQEMLDKAPKLDRVRYVQADISSDSFYPKDKPVDLIFSNAALHWLPNHSSLFPSLLSRLSPGGFLAAQMPDTRRQPSHNLMETAVHNLNLPITFYSKDDFPQDLPVGHKAVRIPRVDYDPEFYYDLLMGECESLKMWSTEYIQRLSGENPVFNFTKTTGLMAVTGVLQSPELEAFTEEYYRLVGEAYPTRPDSFTLFPFRRFFLVAEKKLNA